MAAVPNMIDLDSEESCERSNKKKKKDTKRENKLPPSVSNYFKAKLIEKGSVQAPFSKYPGRKTPHLGH